MMFKKNTMIFIENKKVLKSHISKSELINIKKLKEFSFYDLLDSEYLLNILIPRKKNFDENNIKYFNLSECMGNLINAQIIKLKWIPIKFGNFYVIFFIDEMQMIFDFFAFKTNEG